MLTPSRHRTVLTVRHQDSWYILLDHRMAAFDLLQQPVDMVLKIIRRNFVGRLQLPNASFPFVNPATRLNVVAD
jgi:hypothetical protein